MDIIIDTIMDITFHYGMNMQIKKDSSLLRYDIYERTKF